MKRGVVVGVFLAGAAALASASPPESYLKLWGDPAVQSRIDRNIEQYRKGDAAIEIVDGSGKPLGGATITARQVGHDFSSAATRLFSASSTHPS